MIPSCRSNGYGIIRHQTLHCFQIPYIKEDTKGKKNSPHYRANQNYDSFLNYTNQAFPDTIGCSKSIYACYQAVL